MAYLCSRCGITRRIGNCTDPSCPFQPFGGFYGPILTDPDRAGARKGIPTPIKRNAEPGFRVDDRPINERPPAGIYDPDSRRFFWLYHDGTIVEVPSGIQESDPV